MLQRPEVWCGTKKTRYLPYRRLGQTVINRNKVALIVRLLTEREDMEQDPDSNINRVHCEVFSRTTSAGCTNGSQDSGYEV